MNDELHKLIQRQLNDDKATKWRERSRKRGDFKSAEADKKIADAVERELEQGARARGEERGREWTSPIKNFRSGGLLNNDQEGPRAAGEDVEQQAWKGDDAQAVRESERGYEGRVASGFGKQAGKHRQYSGPLQKTGKLKIFKETPDISERQRGQLRDMVGRLFRGRNATIMEAYLDAPDPEEKRAVIIRMAHQFGIPARRVSDIVYRCKERLSDEAAKGNMTCPACGVQFHRSAGRATDESTLTVKQRIDLMREQRDIMAMIAEEELNAWNVVRIFIEGDRGRDDGQRERHRVYAARVGEIQEVLTAAQVVYCSAKCAPFERGGDLANRPDYWKGRDYPLAGLGSPFTMSVGKIFFSSINPRTD
jgi:hypothetical protein